LIVAVNSEKDRTDAQRDFNLSKHAIGRRLIAFVVFYAIGVGEINKANNQITALEANIASLQNQYTTEKIIEDS